MPASSAFAIRSTEPPQTRTTGGPAPVRSNPIVVRSFDDTFIRVLRCGCADRDPRGPHVSGAWLTLLDSAGGRKSFGERRKFLRRRLLDHRAQHLDDADRRPVERLDLGSPLDVGAVAMRT